jgi:hypothetical protein
MCLKLLRADVLIAASLLFSGCAQGKHPFLMAQMCLSDQHDVSAFVGELKSIASAEKFDFVDRSNDTERELKTVGYVGSERTGGSRVINVGVLRRDGMGLGAGNLGLPGYQVAIGFSEGSNAAEARNFADRVLMRLRKHWRIELVPAGTGAKPMANCN